jgi:hypothetical protein
MAVSDYPPEKIKQDFIYYAVLAAVYSALLALLLAFR